MPSGPHSARCRALALAAFVDASPSPFHACAETAARLERAGFRRIDETRAWPADVGRGYVSRASSLVAWAAPAARAAHTGFKVVAAHTDSPNLRVKARANTGQAGWRQLGVEVYGGALLNSWLDRDLGLSGRVMVRGKDGPEARLVLVDRPLLRVPQLAIHLDREVNTKGLVLDKQTHLQPVWGLGSVDEAGLETLLAAELDCAPSDVLSWDLMLHDVQPSRLIGRDEELLSAPRLDNLCSSFCGLEALLEGLEDEREHLAVLCLFDHEEVGSSSTRGAGGPALRDVLERLVHAAGGSREDYHRAIAGSVCISVDMAHATHPNYPERHEPRHRIAVNAGPVIKINTNQRYASDAAGEALFQSACEEAGVPFQKYFHRSNLACGSTIGPLTAARLGMQTVDVGTPQLSMHSARELCGREDPELLVRALRVLYR
jgi:aspartyl aminopeptidase